MMPAATSEIPVVSLNLTDPEVVQEPVPKLTEIRETAPVLYDPDIDRFVVGGYSDARRCMSQAADFGQDVEFFEKLQGGRAIAVMDNPDHMAIRGILNPRFTPGGVAGLAPFIQGVIDERIDDAVGRIRDGAAVDFVAELNEPIAILTIAHMLGVSEADTPSFVTWAHEMLKTTEASVEPDPARRAELERVGKAATANLNEYAAQQLEERRRRDQDEDLVGMIAHSPVAAELLGDTDQAANVTLFVVAGHDSSLKMMGHMLVALAEHPDQRRAIAEDRSLVPQAIEEVLRWAVSAPLGAKVARHDVMLGGVPLREGSRIFSILSAGNRDPERWENPDKFDIFREYKNHIGFGFGTHSCMGANLTRLELTLLLEAVLDRIPEYQLAEDIEYGPIFLKRGPYRVPLAL